MPDKSTNGAATATVASAAATAEPPPGSVTRARMWYGPSATAGNAPSFTFTDFDCPGFSRMRLVTSPSAASASSSAGSVDRNSVTVTAVLAALSPVLVTVTTGVARAFCPEITAAGNCPTTAASSTAGPGCGSGPGPGPGSGPGPTMRAGAGVHEHVDAAVGGVHDEQVGAVVVIQVRGHDPDPRAAGGEVHVGRERPVRLAGQQADGGVVVVDGRQVRVPVAVEVGGGDLHRPAASRQRSAGRVERAVAAGGEEEHLVQVRQRDRERRPRRPRDRDQLEVERPPRIRQVEAVRQGQRLPAGRGDDVRVRVVGREDFRRPVPVGVAGCQGQAPPLERERKPRREGPVAVAGLERKLVARSAPPGPACRRR